MKYLFVLAFVMVFATCGSELGYTDRSPLYTHFTYMFQHAGIVHLVVNSVAFIGIFHSLQKFVSRWVIAPSMMLCGFVASFLSAHEIPTVGASSMVYAMIGMYIGVTALSRRVRITDTRKYLLFIACVAVGLAVSLFRPGSNFSVHLWSLVGGFVLAAPIALKKS